MEKLKGNLLVLRNIAFHRPHAHLAFLFHKPYRAMYDNVGQNVELCEEHYGQWIYVEEDKTGVWFEKVFMFMKHHENYAYHPQHTSIMFDYSNKHILVMKSPSTIYESFRYDTLKVKYLHYHRSLCWLFIDEIPPINEEKYKFYKDKMQSIHAHKAVTTWKGYIMF